MNESEIQKIKLMIKKRQIPSGKVSSKGYVPDEKLGMVDLGIPFVFADSLSSGKRLSPLRKPFSRKALLIALSFEQRRALPPIEKPFLSKSFLNKNESSK
jgi:hypothetical protein